MSISFTEPAPDPTPSLAYRLGVDGSVRFKTMQSGIRLTYEDNDPELVTVWVAVRPRRTITEELPSRSRYLPMLGFAHA